MSDWTFNGVSLTVAPGWSMTRGFVKQVFRPAGVDGGIPLDNRRECPVWRLTVAALSVDEWTALMQLFDSGIEADFIAPFGDDDTQVFSGAFVCGPGGEESPVEWGQPAPDYWEARLAVICPNVHPVRGSDGTRIV